MTIMCRRRRRPVALLALRALSTCIVTVVFLDFIKTMHVQAFSALPPLTKVSIRIGSPLHGIRRRSSRKRRSSGGDKTLFSFVSAADDLSVVPQADAPPHSPTASVNNSDQTATSNDDSAYTPAATSTTSTESGDETSRASVVPSYKTLLLFCSTTVLIWLSEPLLSLVDTTVVGHSGGPAAVIQLAAMGPATTLADGLLFTTYFLAMATTSLTARAMAAGDYRTLLKTTSHVLGVAAVLGVIVTAVIWTAGPTMLLSMAGTAASPQLVQYALRYCQIRGLTAVCSVWQMVGQAFCLTTQDTRTPALAVAVASGINIVGDLCLRRQGIQGAAMATAVAVSASAAILLSQVWRQVKEWRRLLAEQDERGKPEGRILTSDVGQPLQAQAAIATAAATSQSLTTVAAASEARVPAETQAPEPAEEIPFMSLPDRESFVELIGLSGPLFFNMMGKIICYSALTLRCSAYGVVPLAANTIMMRFFFLYGCFGYSLGQTAQAFLPAALYPVKNPRAVRRIVRRLVALASVVAVSNSLLVAWNVRALGRFLTTDVAVAQAMRDHAVYLGAAIFLHPFIELAEGVVIATRQFRTLIATYVITMATHLTTLACLCHSFTGVWQTLVGFQVIRLANFSVRTWNQRRTTQRLDLQL